MLNDIFVALLTMFVLEPVQAKLGAARAPVAVVEQLADCGRAGVPVLVQRAGSDLWWGVTTVVSVAIGLTSPHSVLAEAHPRCPAALRAAEPYLAATG
jgi:hypothetical protein